MDWLNKYENSTELYHDAKRRWPAHKEHPPGKWILASFDEESIIVYQAYNSDIAKFACENGHFIGCPGYNQQRMTWIKTNFLWMMYRSQWCTSSNQQHILAIWLRRSAFDNYLAQAVHSSEKVLPQEDDEKDSKKKSCQGLIRLQWDPDHHPHGQPVHGRRAIQLGLKRIESFLDGRDIIRIVDITSFVQTQYNNAVLPKDQLDQLRVPIEHIYQPQDEQTRLHIRLDSWEEQEE